MNNSIRMETRMRERLGSRHRRTPEIRTTRGNGRSINALEALKQRLLEEQLTAVTDRTLVRRLQRAADDSASLAWATPFPLLALPELLLEKAREAQRQFERQRAIWSGRVSVTSLAA
jgi:hypothetical protein